MTKPRGVELVRPFYGNAPKPNRDQELSSRRARGLSLRRLAADFGISHVRVLTILRKKAER